MEPVWKEIATLTNPQMNEWNEKPSNHEPTSSKSIYDSSGIQASDNFADGILGSAFGRNVRWFDYSPENETYKKNDGIMRFLQQAALVRYGQFNRSNFYDEARVAVKCCADFGTMIMVRETDIEDKRQVYNTLHLKRCVILEDRYHNIDSLFYDFWIDAFKAVARFGIDKVPEAIRSSYENKDLILYQFTNYIFPVDKFGFKSDMKRLAKGKPYASVIVADVDRETAIAEGGYSKRPFFAWRWSSSMDGTEWGVGNPGLKFLGDGKQANALRRDYSRSSALAAQLPIKATKDLRGRIDLSPGGKTYLNPGEDFAPAQVTGNLQSQLMDLQDLRKSIQEAYMVDIFKILSQNIDQRKTAAEVHGIQGEKAVLMSAFYGRLVSEFLEPVIEDGFQDDFDMGLLPEMPEEIAGEPLEIDMVSPLAMLQRQAVVIDPLNRFMAQATALAQVNPQALDAVDIDAYLAALGQALGVDKGVVRSMYQIKQMRAAKAKLQAEQMAQQQQQAQMQSQADAYNKMRGAPEPGSPMAQQGLEGRR
jgi:hypothetical protein